MEKEFLNVSSVIDDVRAIYAEVRNGIAADDDFKYEILEQYDDDTIFEYAEYLAWKINDEMKQYLNLDDHRIMGNFKNAEYDYDGNFDEMVARLNAGEQSEQADADRDFLTEWFWGAFGSFGIRYNFSNEISEYCYQLECEREKEIYV